MTIVLDSGAIIASENNDPVMAALLKAARKNRTPILVPAAVVAETWRGPGTHPRTALLFASADGFPELNESDARRVGALLALSKTSAIVDGNVVSVAIAQAPSTIVTSDISDISHLLRSARIPYSLFGGRVRSSAQVVIVRV